MGAEIYDIYGYFHRLFRKLMVGQQNPGFWNITIMLQNLSYMYYSHISIIKFVEFEPIYYDINLDVVSSYIVISKFVYLFLIRCITRLNP